MASHHVTLVHGISTVTKHGKWSCKSKKGTGHGFYMATPSHATESVEAIEEILLLQSDGLWFLRLCTFQPHWRGLALLSAAKENN